jgi:hypothetical protein
MSSHPLTPVSLRRRALLALVIGAVGCGGTGPSCLPPGEPDSLYILCQGHGHLYWINNRGEQTDQINVCVPESYLNETGAGGTEGEIDLEAWPNDTEDLEFLRTLCVAQCKTATSNDAESKCEPYRDTANEFDWEVENYLGQATPDPLMYITQPWRRTCASPSALLANAPWETSVVPAGAPVWPGTQDTVSVACGDFGNCADLFTAPIGEVLYYDDTSMLWGADMGYADYLATSSTTSSRLEITISNPGGTPSSDTYYVEGRIEYSAPDCGETECPFYLANLTLTNTEDTWALYSEKLSNGDDGEGTDIFISDLSVQLRRPTLGVWNTSTGQVYLGKERSDIFVYVTHQVGDEPPVEGGYLITNADGIFGEIEEGGGIEIQNLVASDGTDVAFEADIVYDTLVGEPPTADSGLGSTVIAPTGAGLPISSLTDASSDPDGDIEVKIWFVDGIARTYAYIIPIGSHEISLRVIDERGATDYDERIVEILSP